MALSVRDARPARQDEALAPRLPALVRARYLLPLADTVGRSTRIADGYALWREGKLLEVGAFDPTVAERLIASFGTQLQVLTDRGVHRGVAELSDFFQHPGVLMPGFVKCHGHDHEPPIIGICKDMPLTRWLDGVINPFTGFLHDHRDALIERLGRSPQLVSYLKARVDDLCYGITTSMVHHCNFAKYFGDDLALAAETAGTQMIIAVGGQDRHYVERLLDTPHQATARLDGYLARHGDSALVRFIPGPDQFFSNGPEMLKELKAWARGHGTLLHCHSSEEKGTTAWFRRTYGQTPVEYAHSIGVLDRDTVVAHQVHCTERDLEILAETGVSVVHNPLANTILGSGMPPIPEMLRRGIPVAISTDGSGSADNQNILAAARLASQYQKALHSDAELLPAQQVLEMITVDAAKMLRMDAGSLAVGMRADLIVVDVTRPNMVPTRLGSVVENLIWASDGSEVELVVGGGRILRQGDVFHTLDVKQILQDVDVLSESFERHLAQAGAMQGTGANR